SGGPSNGVLSGAPPNITYTPNPNFFGSDSFSFRVQDPSGAFDVGVVSITVNPINDAPIAGDDTAVTEQDVPINIPTAARLANATDVDSSTLTITSVQSTGAGTAVLGGSFVTFTPAPGFIGFDSFQYTVSDG